MCGPPTRRPAAAHVLLQQLHAGLQHQRHVNLVRVDCSKQAEWEGRMRGTPTWRLAAAQVLLQQLNAGLQHQRHVTLVRTGC